MMRVNRVMGVIKNQAESAQPLKGALIWIM
jgi:hypothetical protein